MNIILLFCAGILGGAINAAAGGGMFVGFPVLLALGIPSVSANATATLAIFPGTIATMVGYRTELMAQKDDMVRVWWISLIGGALGSLLLLSISNRTFSSMVPYLILLATVVFTVSPYVLKWVSRGEIRGPSTGGYLTWGLVLMICIYGGFFGAGMGIMMLAAFGLMGMTHLHKMNALRALAGLASNSIGLLVFAGAGVIQWHAALVMGCGAALGGYVSGRVFRRLPVHWMRRLILGIAWTLSVGFLIRLWM